MLDPPFPHLPPPTGSVPIALNSSAGVSRRVTFIRTFSIAVVSYVYFPDSLLHWQLLPVELPLVTPTDPEYAKK